MSQVKEISLGLDATPDVTPAPELSDVDSIELKIAENESRLRQYRRRTSVFLYLIASLMVLGLSTAIGAPALRTVLPEINFNLRFVGFVGAVYALLMLLTGAFMRTVKIASIEQETDNLAAKKRILSKAASTLLTNQEQPAVTYFDRLVDINITNLGAYYTLVKYQTNNSFLVSISVGVFGFALISTGLIFGFNNSANVKITYVATASGIITEFIASVFFYLYNRTVRQMKEYHDSLITVQNVLLAFKIVGDTKDENEKTKMVGQLLRYLVARNVSPLAGNGSQSKDQESQVVPH